ncbi:hypothetical protein F5B21DRAFT_497625 [Xylaria acuta]|nr:hypothetical protein F5B21DRAFT_497625 [Xylaria acuta]
MLTPLHEHMARSLDNLVTGWLRSLRGRRRGLKEVSEAARSMVFQGSANIPLVGIRTRRPDNSYRHNRCKYPGLVMSVAWRKPASYLRESAEAFINETRGVVRTVIGIDLNEVYEARKRNETEDAKFFVWRATFGSSGGYSGIEKNEDMVFQNRAGRAVSSTKLELSFQDFLCERTANKLAADNPKFEVPASELSRIINEGLATLKM